MWGMIGVLYHSVTAKRHDRLTLNVNFRQKFILRCHVVKLHLGLDFI